MSEDDLFSTVAEEFDTNLSPNLHGERSPAVSSGVSSSQSSVGRWDPHSHSPATLPTVSPCSSVFTCTFGACKKTYKTKRGFDRHVFIHEISEINSRKPDKEAIAGALHDIVISILEEIKNEVGSPEEKINIIDEVLCSQNSPNWLYFLNSVSEPILQALTERKKILPTNQYDEFLSNLNHTFSVPVFLDNLKCKFKMLLVNKPFEDSRFIGMTLFRLCFRLGEELQTLILKEMAREGDSRRQEVLASDTSDPQEIKLLHSKISSIVRIYFTKAMSLDAEVWRARRECIRHSFIESVDLLSLKSSEIVQKSLWVEGKIFLTKEVLHFCTSVLNIIDAEVRKFKVSVSPDVVVKTILLPHFSDLVMNWHSLTSGYLSEIDSMVFMRDLISILIKVSLQLEEGKMKRQVEGRQRLQKFATRDNLKRN